MLDQQDQDNANLDNISQEEGAQMLRDLCEQGFDKHMDMVALALGRDEDNINAMLEGSEEIDEDLIMKIRGIAQERNIAIEEASQHAAG